MEEMQIRSLTTADAAVLQACRLAGLLESPEAFLTAYSDVKDTPLVQVEAELEEPDIRYLGAFAGGHLVGFMRYVRASRQSRRHVAEVRSVYVTASSRGQGVARKLLLQLIEDAKRSGIESLVLSVLANNAAAVGLYESVGFCIYGREPNAVKKGAEYVDQLHLWLDLSAVASPVR